RHLLAGCDRADSLAWNPHKMMGMPLTCSVVLLRESGLLAKSLDESAEYLFQTAPGELNPGRRSIQCGRRNDALKLWAAWRLHGDDGYANRISQQFALAQYAVSVIRAQPRLSLIREPQSINVCFDVVGTSAVDVCTWLEQERAIRIGHATVNGRTVIRLVCVNPDLSNTDLDALFEA
ncbi:MAG: PLP-dependent decarboxylase, partial [bacterium]|nr:PLP-dependent decarboxylase [bacterium]